MRIAFVPDGDTVNTAYRSIGPITELSKRGHETRQLNPFDRRGANALLRWCDLLHIHRWCDDETVKLAESAKAAGAAVVWDDDDDSLRPPPEISGKRLITGREAAIRLAARARLFGIADLVTTTNHRLGDVFRADGAREVQVIENHVIDGIVSGPTRRSGIQIGWAALREHELDLAYIPIVRTLDALLAAHPDLQVTTIGIRLEQLRSARYEHVPSMPMQDLMRHMAGFDIGIAPLSPEIRMNHARSNVKVKEYAALGVPWLASPIGPYAGLGERQGGRLVPDDRWFEELDALIRSGRARRRLAKHATRWGREQLLSRNVKCWERVFEHALSRACRAAA
jgi:hypothetical protein